MANILLNPEGIAGRATFREGGESLKVWEYPGRREGRPKHNWATRTLKEMWEQIREWVRGQGGWEEFRHFGEGDENIKRDWPHAAQLKSMLSREYGPVIFDEEGNRTDWFVHIRERLLLARPAPAAPAARRSTEDHPVLSRQKSQDVSAHGPAIEDFADFWQARLREHQSTSWRSNYDIRVSSPHGQRVMAHYLPLIEHELDRLQTAANQDHIPLGGILGDDGRAVRRGAGTRDGDFLPGQDEATAADNVASATHARNRNYVCAAENGEVPPN